MTFADSVTKCFRNYVTFSGRASQSEYWWFILFVLVGSVIATIIEVAVLGQPVVYETTSTSFSVSTHGGPLSGLFSLLTLLPGISVFVRRMHDTGRSGWWFWLGLIPLIGWIFLLVWLCTRGTAGANKYGEPVTDAKPAAV